MPIIKKDFNLNNLGSFKIGGTADFYAEITDPQELPALFLAIKETKKPYFVIGGATNVLFPTQNYPGWIIKMNNQGLQEDKPTFVADSGLLLSVLVQKANRAGAAGLEKLAGIPGTVGGGIRGNAGAHGAEVSTMVQKVTAYRPSTNSLEIFPKEQCAFGYRTSLFAQNKDLIIVSVEFLLKEEDPVVLEERSNKILIARQNQPYTRYPSAGSVFKNVTVAQIENQSARERLLFNYTKDMVSKNGDPDKPAAEPPAYISAGYLVEEAGLKGKKVGGAAVSSEHGNIIINLGNATAEDVIMLISIIKTRVRDELGVQLQEEITYVN